jgi:hypothetical protein
MATSTTMRRLLALVHEYAREPVPIDPDAAIRRDVAYFDRLLILLSQQDEPGAARGRALATGAGEYRVRWSIDVGAGGAVDAARQARRIQLRPMSLATLFEVFRHDGAGDELDWSLAETVDLTAYARSDHEALDEIARVLRAPAWRGADDMPYIAELVRLTGRDTADPVTPEEQIDWR